MLNICFHFRIWFFFIIIYKNLIFRTRNRSPSVEDAPKDLIIEKQKKIEPVKALPEKNAVEGKEEEEAVIIKKPSRMVVIVTQRDSHQPFIKW